MSSDAFAGSGCAINAFIFAIVVAALTIGGSVVLFGQWVWSHTHFPA